jgi:hypothetical protein
MRHYRLALPPLAAAAFLLAAVPAFAATPAAAPERGDSVDAIPVPAAIVTKNVPAIPQSAVEPLRPYQNTRAAALQEWHPRERAILITTRFAETNQLHEVAMPMGARTQITFEADRVAGGTYRPRHPEQLVFARDEGGAENYQLYLLDRASGRIRRFTDGTHRHLGGLWSRDGRQIAYVGNARNGRDMDLYLWQPEAGGEGRLLAELQGDWSALDWSFDGTRLLATESISVHESYLYEVDAATGAVKALTPRREGQPVAYEGGRWTPDGRAVYTTTDKDGEFRRLVRLDLASGEHTVLSGDLAWDVESFDLSDDGAVLAFVSNEEGTSKLHLLDTATGRELPAPELPPARRATSSSAPAATRWGSACRGRARPPTSTATTPRRGSSSAGRRARWAGSTRRASSPPSWSASPPSTRSPPACGAPSRPGSTAPPPSASPDRARW